MISYSPFLRVSPSRIGEREPNTLPSGQPASIWNLTYHHLIAGFLPPQLEFAAQCEFGRRFTPDIIAIKLNP
jgi:hypothetical protein